MSRERADLVCCSSWTPPRWGRICARLSFTSLPCATDAVLYQGSSRSVPQDSRVKVIVEWFLRVVWRPIYGQDSARIVKGPTLPSGWLHPASFVS
jgi:hypothetical protein